MQQLYKQKSLLVSLFIAVCLSFQGVQASNGVWFVAEGTIITGAAHVEGGQQLSSQIFIAQGTTMSGTELFNQQAASVLTSNQKDATDTTGNFDNTHLANVSKAAKSPIAQKQNPTKPKEHIQEKVTQAASKTQQHFPKSTFPFLPKDAPTQLATFVTATTSVNTSFEIHSAAATALNRFTSIVFQKTNAQHKKHNQNLPSQLQWRTNHTSRPPPVL